MIGRRLLFCLAGFGLATVLWVGGCLVLDPGGAGMLGLFAASVLLGSLLSGWLQPHPDRPWVVALACAPGHVLALALLIGSAVGALPPGTLLLAPPILLSSTAFTWLGLRLARAKTGRVLRAAAWVALAALFCFGARPLQRTWQRLNRPAPAAAVAAPAATTRKPVAAAPSRSAAAPEAHWRDGSQVEGSGTVVEILADDNKGSRHQRFIIRTPSGRRLFVAHNIDLAPRAPIRMGDTVTFRGVYESDRGGVIHWTHHDPKGRRAGGWLQCRGQTCR